MRATAEELFRSMYRVRRFELRADELFASGVIPGVLHLSLGQEGAAAGVCAALRPTDRITSTHRGHHHMVAKGANLAAMYAELFARSTGCCSGKGGSMHIADISVGALGANGLVGGGIPLAVGSALSAQMLGEDVVTVAFFGDGAVNTGVFHESLNLASIWSLPILFVCENNVWTQFTRATDTLGAESILARAAAYRIPAVTVQGKDVLAVHEAASPAVSAARAGEGPQFIEVFCPRLRGHTVGDSRILGGVDYRTPADLAGAEASDPIAYLLHSDRVPPERVAQIRAEVDMEIEAAVQQAMQGPEPNPADAFRMSAWGV